MSYTESQLLPGERIKYRARLHWLPFLPAFLGLALSVTVAILGALTQNWLLASAFALLAAIVGLWTYIALTTSEFSVTDRRVIIKVGWIRRRTLETMLAKVEGIGVEQSMLGRLAGFGTIVVTGTGGTREPFRNMAAPLEFRRQVQAAVSAGEEAREIGALRGASASGVAAVGSAGERDERECPYCAELILKKARVCKHCQRDVTPLVM